LGQVAFGAAAFTTRGLFAEQLTRTPFQTEGPFYPDKLPLDTDNDLLIINDGITPAIGEITHLTGKLMDENGNPIKSALVEIWQVNAKGSYIHSQDPSGNERDPNFQGFGRFLTSSTGDYYFRTIKPVPYPGRTPHIHFKVKIKDRPEYTTQCYIKGHPQNEQDGIFRRVAEDRKALESILVDFKPIEDSQIGELAAKFDIVLGLTPEDTEQQQRLRGQDRGRG
jgi:protocatechuate 3,4-dioxygenase beta subunit